MDTHQTCPAIEYCHKSLYILLLFPNRYALSVPLVGYKSQLKTGVSRGIQLSVFIRFGCKIAIRRSLLQRKEHYQNVVTNRQLNASVRVSFMTRACLFPLNFVRSWLVLRVCQAATGC